MCIRDSGEDRAQPVIWHERLRLACGLEIPPVGWDFAGAICRRLQSCRNCHRLESPSGTCAPICVGNEFEVLDHNFCVRFGYLSCNFADVMGPGVRRGGLPEHEDGRCVGWVRKCCKPCGPTWINSYEGAGCHWCSIAWHSYWIGR